MVNPLITNNFLDSCAFDPKYEPEDTSAREIYSLHESGTIQIVIAHSTRKEIEHPNTPAWVKSAALRLIHTLDLDLSESERQLLARLETVLAGAGSVEAIRPDALHIFEAQKYGSFFITTDVRILKRAAQLKGVCGVSILKPSEFLALAQKHVAEEAEEGPPASAPKSSEPTPAGHSGTSGVQSISYKGYSIEPVSFRLRDSQRWTLGVLIWRDKGYEVATRSFSTRNDFSTKAEAQRAAIDLGRKLIDGQIADFTVNDM